jgi:hypothetical protein
LNEHKKQQKERKEKKCHNNYIIKVLSNNYTWYYCLRRHEEGEVKEKGKKRLCLERNSNSTGQNAPLSWYKVMMNRWDILLLHSLSLDSWTQRLVG